MNKKYLKVILLLLTSLIFACVDKTTPEKIQIATSDFIYNDTIEGFKILIKKGLSYRTKKYPETIFTASTDQFLSKNNNVGYSITRGKYKGILPQDTFLMYYQTYPNERWHISNMAITEYKKGFKKGTADIR